MSDEDQDAANEPHPALQSPLQPAVDSKRKSKKVMADGSVSWEHVEEHLEGRRNFDLESRIKSDSYSKATESFVLRIESGEDLTVTHFQKNGFIRPIYVLDKEGLGMKVPGRGFSVSDVRAAVGSRRQIDVMDVNTQKNSQMSMKDFQKYFDQNPEDRKELWNVISLEVSNTKLEPQVVAPRVVRQIDWVDKVWPRHLKEMQIEATNSIEDMMYPKVQKYCLMSVRGCWTDFHIDFGGTSVWYHVVQGSKLFWLVPPTDDNLKKYEEWVLSGKQSDIFFGDIVENCGRFEIPQGGTFFIPSGWIHGVYTPQDSIVFGGNFLHSFSIEKQLQVAHIEEVTRVPTKFRFPFFTEMLWYALDRYIHCLTGRTHLDLPEEEKRRMRLEKGENIDPNKEVLKVVSSNAGAASGAATPGSTATATAPQVHLTAMELQGLKFIVMYLHHLPHSKKNIPLMLPDPISVVKDIRALVTEHANDCPEKAVTGKYILRWTESDDVDGGLAKRPRKHLPKLIPGTTIERERKKPGPKPGSTRQKLEQKSTMASPRVPSGTRRRRVRCRNCEACLGSDCRACQYCKDMIKYGGPGKMKQTCEKRRCIYPQLPISSFCRVCKLDGWMNEPKQTKESERPAESPDLYECTICLVIVHPQCAQKTTGLGKVNPDFSNSWECATCLSDGYTSNRFGAVSPNTLKREIYENIVDHSEDSQSSISKKAKIDD